MTEQSEQIALEEIDVELPPAIEKALTQLKKSRRHLLRTKEYGDQVKQLRAFIGQYTYPELSQLTQLFGAMFMDAYSVAVSNANQLQRMQTFVVREFQKLGADIDEDTPLPGVSSEVIDEFQQAFYAVGAKLSEKLPDDPEMQEVWNRCAGLLSDVVRDLMGMADDDEGDDRDRDDDSDDDSDDGGAKKAAEAAEQGAEQSQQNDPKTEEPNDESEEKDQ